MFLAMGLVLVIFILLALAITWSCPASSCSLIVGVMQAFDAVLRSLRHPVADPDRRITLVAGLAGRHARPGWRGRPRACC